MRGRRLTRRRGKRAIVVGGTSGIGEGIALRFAKARVAVTIIGRSAERGNEVLERLKQACNDVEHRFVPLDCSLVSNALQFAKEERETYSSLDFLVLTVGMVATSFHPTKEGIDSKLAVHYFSRVAFMQGLAPLLEKGEDPRVISVLSGGIHGPYHGYETNFALSEASYGVKDSADAPGMYNDIAMEKLAGEHPSLAFFHASPGFISTNWGSEFPWYLKGPVRLMQRFGRSTKDCGELLCVPLFDSQWKATAGQRNWHIVDQYGAITERVTGIHDQAKDSVWSQTTQLLQPFTPSA